ncbi:hypothetical protein C8J57DRAFT_1493916 [Mycena rebaudengoi]|nr:hypothetical protein C8J57DRAFT_1493916 [Mycena rebaudengoi]
MEEDPPPESPPYVPSRSSSRSSSPTRPHFESKIEDIHITNLFIETLKNASLDDEKENLDPDLVSRLRNPPKEPPTLTSDERLSIDLYLSISNASVETYDSVRTAILRRHPDDEILSYYRVKNLVSDLSGVTSIVRDMCINSCHAFTGPFADAEHCTTCAEPRYDPLRLPAKIPRKQYHTIPLGPQLQAIRRSKEGATQLEYRKRCTDAILAELERNGNVRSSAYRDFFDGTDYLEAVINRKIKPPTVGYMFGFFLTVQPRSATTKRYILPGGFISGPNPPKNSDSYIYTGLYHLAALQREGLASWDANTGHVETSHTFLALGTADGPGMACLNGCVGHQGKHGCRVYCGMASRRKTGASTYYPVRFKPDNYSVNGCDHDDIHLAPLLDGFDPEEAADRYKNNLRYVEEAPNKSQYEKRRLATGISKPTIFSGLDPEHILGIPDIFGLDFMHSRPLILLTSSLTSGFGQTVADLTKWIPGSFDRPPRNPAERISSGYKAWEFLLLFYGMGPALLYGILPEKYWRNYCKLVRAIRILLQQDILPVELAEAHSLMTAFSDEFEQLYVQRLESRMHFVRPAIHTLSHMPGETARKGPGNIYSQWALERTIGNLGQEIRQHSNPYANLAMRGIRRCQVNALTAFIPDLDPEPVFGPRGSINVGGGFFLLRATDSCKRKVRQCEEDAIREYIDDNADDEGLAERWNGLVARWARARLPNGQTARSAFQESRRSDPTRAARHVKVLLDGVLELAEVQFYMHLVIEEKDHYIHQENAPLLIRSDSPTFRLI